MSNGTLPQDNFPKELPGQIQDKQPGIEAMMNPRPIFDHSEYNKASSRLENKKAIITGGDSGIGRAISIAYAKEGADVAIVYLDEHQDAEETKKIIEGYGRKCLLIPGDIGEEDFCYKAVEEVVKNFGGVDILVNNAAEQHCQNSIEDITKEQMERTFKTNFFGLFFMSKSVMPHFKPGCCIINTASITAYKGNETLIDYSATKGAVVSFTRSLSISLAARNIRVNAVAPGPIWTPLIPSSFNESDVAQFGKDVHLQRVGQPVELAQAYVFLASQDASYVTGQTIHVNGGEIVNG